MKFEVTVLGCSSATPIYKRHPSAQVINHNERLYLVDCGEGTQQQLQRYGIRANKIRDIFISHLHGDHFFGLVGLLSSMHLVGRTDPLHLYAPEPLKEIIDLQLFHSQTVLRYDLIFHSTRSDQREILMENEHLRVRTFPLEHRIPCTGLKFEEKVRNPKIDAEKVQALGIPASYYSLIKQGNGYTDPAGRFYTTEELTQPPPPPRSYAYCSDTLCTFAYLEDIKEVNLLYHEATFMHDMIGRAEETYHTTALQAGQIALQAGAGALLIGHFSARYKQLHPLLEESRTVFPETMLATEGQTYEIRY